MNNIVTKTIFLISFLAVIACEAPPHSSKQVVEAGPIKPTTANLGTDWPIDLEKSIIRWKGTKMMRTGKHEGTLSFKEGKLSFNGDQLTGGYFIADMKSIKITDIPPHETVPIRNLTNHLNSDFDTRQYPTSKFEMTQVNYINPTRLEIKGNLSIKDVTKHIAIEASVDPQNNEAKVFTSTFSFNRFDWNIGIDGSWLERKLVDEDILLSIEIRSIQENH